MKDVDANYDWIGTKPRLEFDLSKLGVGISRGLIGGGQFLSLSVGGGGLGWGFGLERKGVKTL